LTPERSRPYTGLVAVRDFVVGGSVAGIEALLGLVAVLPPHLPAVVLADMHVEAETRFALSRIALVRGPRNNGFRPRSTTVGGAERPAAASRRSTARRRR
jgi:hypothetical protein